MPEESTGYCQQEAAPNSLKGKASLQLTKSRLKIYNPQIKQAKGNI